MQSEDIRNMIDGAWADMRAAIASDGLTLDAFAEATEGRNITLDHVANIISSTPGPDDMRVSCRKGCAHCCHQLVMATPMEIFLLARHVNENWPADERAALVEKLRHLAAIPANEEDRTSRSLPCPLLKDNACSAYAARPGACRGLLSYSDKACAAGLDAKPADRQKHPIPSPEFPFLVLQFTQYGLDAGLHELGLDIERVDLAHGLLLALTISSAAEDWLAGKDVLAPARVAVLMSNRDIVTKTLERFQL